MSKKNKAIILLSSGLDSCTALACAVKEQTVILALTFDYGQRSARKEITSAKRIAKFYKIKHQAIPLPWFKNIINSSLVNKTKSIPVLTSAADGNEKTAQAVWVPNRNGLFLNIAAAFAESLNAKTIITGFNAEEAQTFPDNSLEFCQAADKFFSFSTLNKVKVKNYFYKNSKPQIIKIALQNKAPLQYIWSCYQGKKRFCGKCESCQRLKNALVQNNLLEYFVKKYQNYRGLL